MFLPNWPLWQAKSSKLKANADIILTTFFYCRMISDWLHVNSDWHLFNCSDPKFVTSGPHEVSSSSCLAVSSSIAISVSMQVAAPQLSLFMKT